MDFGHIRLCPLLPIYVVIKVGCLHEIVYSACEMYSHDNPSTCTGCVISMTVLPPERYCTYIYTYVLVYVTIHAKTDHKSAKIIFELAVLVRYGYFYVRATKKCYCPNCNFVYAIRVE